LSAYTSTLHPDQPVHAFTSSNQSSAKSHAYA
jgi:hypothetical protein